MKSLRSPMSSRSEISEYSKELSEEAIGNGLIGEDILETINSSEEEWSAASRSWATPMRASVEDFDEWFDQDTDFSSSKAVYEEGTAQEHRPS